ncbi:MAG: ZIP family metal transporter [Pirellulaceae bacterium]
MWPVTLITIYGVCLIVASLAGGWLPSMMQLTHTRMQLMMSFVGGLMMGVAILHLLPHAVVQTESLDYAAWSCILGLLTMFLTIRVFNVHQHGPIMEPGEKQSASPQHLHAHDDCKHPAERADASPHRFTWFGLFLGLAVHSLIDGVAVAASVVAAVDHGSTWGLLGAGTFFAVLFHKPLDSLSITSVMAVGSWSRRARDVVNLLFSLICPAGALLFYFGTRELGAGQHIAIGCTLGFSAGVFLCISLADILPEIQFHHHDRVKLSAALLIGVALSFAIGLFESEHAHDHGHDHDHGHAAEHVTNDE